MKTIMGAFSCLKQALEQNEQNGCETTSAAKNFVSEYDKQVEAEKQSLQERQGQDRKERSASEGAC